MARPTGSSPATGPDLRAGDDHAADGHGDPLPRLPRHQDGPASRGPKEGEIADGAGELGFFPPYSWWPLWCGARARRHRLRHGAGCLVAAHHRRGSRRDRPVGLGLRVLPRRARPLAPDPRGTRPERLRLREISPVPSIRGSGGVPGYIGASVHYLRGV